MRRTWLCAALLLLPACGQNPDEAAAPAPRRAAPSGQVQAAPAAGGGSPIMSLDRAVECREVERLLHVQRFTLEEPHEYHWMKDHPDVTAGLLVVIEVEPECARPREAAMPVLYVGQVPAEIAMEDWRSGRLVLVVPGDVDLSRTPVFFGAPELPERVDRERGASELAAAVKAGIVPFPADVVTVALDRGGSALHLTDTTALYQAAADLAPGHAQPLTGI